VQAHFGTDLRHALKEPEMIEIKPSICPPPCNRSMNEQDLICLDGIPGEKQEAYVRQRAKWFDMRLCKSRCYTGAYMLVYQMRPAHIKQDNLSLVEIVGILNEMFNDARRQVKRALEAGSENNST
jgi:hypothetical protein